MGGEQPRVLCFGRLCDALPGGIQSHVAGLLESLKGKVDFLNLVPSRDYRETRFFQGRVPVIRTPGWDVDGSLVLSPALVGEAWRQHRGNPFDLIHLHFPDPMSHFASMAIPANVPRIITWHADIVRQKHLLKLYRPWQRRVLSQAAAIIVATPAHLSSSPNLSARGVCNKVRVIPYGFNLSRFSVTDVAGVRSIREAYPGRLLFALGRHVSYKGFDVLLQAMAAQAPDVQLLLGGIGPLSETLRQQAKALGVSDRVHFLGLVKDALLPAYYQASDLFCLPSVTQAEAFGIVQVEAMAAGCPVVSTCLGNGVDFVNQNGITGLTVPPGDPGALASALATLLKDENRRRLLGRRAQERALAEFSLEAMGERTFGLYQEVLGR